MAILRRKKAVSSQPSALSRLLIAMNGYFRISGRSLDNPGSEIGLLEADSRQLLR